MLAPFQCTFGVKKSAKKSSKAVIGLKLISKKVTKENKLGILTILSGKSLLPVLLPFIYY